MCGRRKSDVRKHKPDVRMPWLDVRMPKYDVHRPESVGRWHKPVSSMRPALNGRIALLFLFIYKESGCE